MKPTAASVVSRVIQWEVYWRRDDKSPWMQFATKHSEDEGRSAFLAAGRRYPRYDVELRKVTITEERVDGTG